jgi:phage shock protein PspC (stress-responsive transcriptional regulator)
MANSKRLMRSSSNKLLAGVCGGVGEYLDIDPTVIRLLWIVLTFLAGGGILLYIICLFIMPKDF